MNENILKEEIAMLENQIRILQQENQKYKELIEEYETRIKYALEELEEHQKCIVTKKDWNN